MKFKCCVVEPLGPADGPKIALALARTRRAATRRRMVVVDCDTTRRLQALLWEEVDPPRPTMTVASALESLARFTSDPGVPATLRVGDLEIAMGGAALEGAWQAVTAAAIATGFALPVVERLGAALDSIGGSRELMIVAPPGMSGLGAGVLAACDAVVVVLPPADLHDYVLASRWLSGVLNAGQDSGPSVVVPVLSVLDPRTTREARTRRRGDIAIAFASTQDWSPEWAEVCPPSSWSFALAEAANLASERVWEKLGIAAHGPRQGSTDG